MKFKILTLFPEIFPGPLSHSISGKALQKKLLETSQKQSRKQLTTNLLVVVQE